MADLSGGLPGDPLPVQRLRYPGLQAHSSHGPEVYPRQAIRGTADSLTYLCWTVSPKYSCVMEYTAGTVTEEDVFRMAESVGGVK